MGRTWAEQSILERMVSAVERVRERLSRATAALEAAGVPYAVVGGNAVAAWVATVDPGAVRNTQDVDILLRRSDLDAAERALATAGFVRRHVAGIDLHPEAVDNHEMGLAFEELIRKFAELNGGHKACRARQMASKTGNKPHLDQIRLNKRKSRRYDPLGHSPEH